MSTRSLAEFDRVCFFRRNKSDVKLVPRASSQLWTAENLATRWPPDDVRLIRKVWSGVTRRQQASVPAENTD